jgi:hypothetical protein
MLAGVDEEREKRHVENDGLRIHQRDEERLPGDEPEPMRVDQTSLRELSSLIQHPQFTEGRALAALYLARDVLTQRGVFKP